jgi:CRISPR-associated endonuclease/helicase Cas3
MGRHFPGEAGDRLDVLWAKLPRGSQQSTGYHPLLAHTIDVAQVARLLWREVLPLAASQTIGQELGVSPEIGGEWVALWAGLHDLGKAAPAFASQNGLAWERIKQAGFACPHAPAKPREAPHGTITAVALPDILTARLSLPRSLARQVGRLIGGHHGVFPQSVDVRKVARNEDAVGSSSWATAREELALGLSRLLGMSDTMLTAERLSHQTSMYLAGLVSVADWIGSNATYFEYLVPDADARQSIDWPGYVQLSTQRANDALAKLGWLGWPTPVGRPTFTKLFPSIAVPRPLQDTVSDLADELRGPCLVAIEAPMGEGKTEAALFLADRWGAEQDRGGSLYVALPTQATSNQMFGRVQRFLEHRHPGKIVNLQLLHGHAELSSQLQVLRENAAVLFAPSSIHDEDDDQAHDATVIAAEWFTARKRGLLAPFGVGTVDQLLLAVLKTRHGFVRLFGLGHKTIVVDEVHAYDTYMTSLLERLLHWLAALGASVVLLSATLPRARLTRLLAAYAAGRPLPAEAPRQPPEVPYPRMSWVDARGVEARAVPPSSRSVTIQIERLTDTLPSLDAALTDAPTPPFTLGERLAAALAPGGCAAVICTTVGRAQRTYLALKRMFAALPEHERPDVYLFHARYRFGERDAREKLALARFGKDRETALVIDGQAQTISRPARAVLVATQVIEQSLDLDFDLMTSELAPVDLVLQRLGRLHRHARGDRPAHLNVPTLWLLQPNEADGAPVFERDQKAVYDEHILLRSWLALRDRDTIRVPDDLEPLIRQVYDDAECAADAPAAVQACWSASNEHLNRARAEQERKANDAVFVPPDYSGDIFELFNPQLAEDDPTAHQTLQAVTRLGDPSLPVVLLTVGEEELADLDAERPGIEQVRALLERSATLSHRGLVPYLLSEAGQQEVTPHRRWRRSALLRHHRLLRLDADGRAEVGQYTVRLDRDLGILVERRG